MVLVFSPFFFALFHALATGLTGKVNIGPLPKRDFFTFVATVFSPMPFLKHRFSDISLLSTNKAGSKHLPGFVVAFEAAIFETFVVFAGSELFGFTTIFAFEIKKWLPL